MDDKVFDQIQQVDLKKNPIENSPTSTYNDLKRYGRYASGLSGIGLKPVQRRVLYSMIELRNTPDKPLHLLSRSFYLCSLVCSFVYVTALSLTNCDTLALPFLSKYLVPDYCKIFFHIICKIQVLNHP